MAWAHSKSSFFPSNFDQIFIHFLMPHSGTHFLSFWCDLGPKRSILGAPWRPAGAQMAPKIGQRAPKIAQVAPKSSARTKDGGTFSLPIWMCLTHRTIMYKGILVVGAYYDEIENLMKKWCQKAPKINAKIAIWAIRGPTFEVLGHVFGQTVC